MIYISTDYVFDGQGTRPWEPDDERHPLNVYGQTKYEGELAVEKWVKKFYIVRIAWVFGVNGKNFIKTMLNLEMCIRDRFYAEFDEKTVPSDGVLPDKHELAECQQAETAWAFKGGIAAGSGAWFRQCPVFPDPPEPRCEREVPRGGH